MYSRKQHVWFMHVLLIAEHALAGSMFVSVLY